MFGDARFPASILAEIRSFPGNDCCCDCGSRDTDWASVSHGTLVCLACAGRHRGLGVAISRVRSLTMDTWDAVQVEMMRQGGNGKLRRFFRRLEMADEQTSVNGSGGSNRGSEGDGMFRGLGVTVGGGGQTVPTIYCSEAAEFYRLKLRERVDAARTISSEKSSSIHVKSGNTLVSYGGITSTPVDGSLRDGENISRKNSEMRKGKYFSVIFGPGVMGMTLTKNGGVGQTVVSRVTAGSPAVLGGVVAGDCLVEVGGMYVARYEDAMRAIQTMPRPLSVSFMRYSTVPELSDLTVSKVNEAVSEENNAVSKENEAADTTDAEAIIGECISSAEKLLETIPSSTEQSNLMNRRTGSGPSAEGSLETDAEDTRTGSEASLASLLIPNIQTSTYGDHSARHSALTVELSSYRDQETITAPTSPSHTTPSPPLTPTLPTDLLKLRVLPSLPEAQSSQEWRKSLRLQSPRSVEIGALSVGGGRISLTPSFDQTENLENSVVNLLIDESAKEQNCGGYVPPPLPPPLSTRNNVPSIPLTIQEDDVDEVKTVGSDCGVESESEGWLDRRKRVTSAELSAGLLGYLQAGAMVRVATEDRWRTAMICRPHADGVSFKVVFRNGVVERRVDLSRIALPRDVLAEIGVLHLAEESTLITEPMKVLSFTSQQYITPPVRSNFSLKSQEISTFSPPITPQSAVCGTHTSFPSVPTTADSFTTFPGGTSLVDSAASSPMDPSAWAALAVSKSTEHQNLVPTVASLSIGVAALSISSQSSSFFSTETPPNEIISNYERHVATFTGSPLGLTLGENLGGRPEVVRIKIGGAAESAGVHVGDLLVRVECSVDGGGDVFSYDDAIARLQTSTYPIRLTFLSSH